jgi:hypothetical protein
MKCLSLIILVLFLSCERHESVSRVTEVVNLNNDPLTAVENLQKAFIERDYNFLEEQFSAGVNVDTPVFEGQTLLYKAVEALEYKLVDFLLGHGANPEAPVLLEGETLSPNTLATTIADTKIRDVMKSLLAGKMDDVNDDIFFDMVKAIDPNEVIDLEWASRLVSSGVDFESVSKKDFSRLFIKSAPKAANTNEFFAILFKDLSLVPVTKWIDWSEHTFRAGYYKRAKCEFYKEAKCANFQQFLSSCIPKMQERLAKAESKISPYLNLRNHLLKCE